MGKEILKCLTLVIRRRLRSPVNSDSARLPRGHIHNRVIIVVRPQSAQHCAKPDGNPQSSGEHRLVKFFKQAPMLKCMTISNSSTSLLDSVLTAQSTRQDIGVSVLKKAQDTMKQQGEAMVHLLDAAGDQSMGGGNPQLDAYA
jgi:hypothetical protein